MAAWFSETIRAVDDPPLAKVRKDGIRPPCRVASLYGLGYTFFNKSA